MTNKKRKTKTANNKRQIETYEHRNKERINNPPVVYKGRVTTPLFWR